MPNVVTTYQGDLVFETRAGAHTIITDGPQQWGGLDRGPLPPELFMASIGSCVGVMVTHFCQLHAINAEGLQVDVQYSDSAHPACFEDIRVRIDLPNAHCGDEATARALEYVAKHCPVQESIMTLEKVMFEINV